MLLYQQQLLAAKSQLPLTQQQQQQQQQLQYLQLLQQQQRALLMMNPSLAPMASTANRTEVKPFFSFPAPLPSLSLSLNPYSMFPLLSSFSNPTPLSSTSTHVSNGETNGVLFYFYFLISFLFVSNLTDVVSLFIRNYQVRRR
jgi:hypothetical protein